MTSFPKRSLIRFVAQDGKLALDAQGHSDGRGVYLCCSLDCFDKAVKRKKFSGARGVSFSVDEVAALRKEFEAICSGGEVNEC
jgi:predicted RNA-binding protein YlxR (DUF448 family)